MLTTKVKKVLLVAFLLGTVLMVQPIYAQEGLGTRLLQGGKKAIVIDSPGNYALRDTLSVPGGDAITITSSNVTLDLQGNSVNTDAPATGRGIWITGAKSVEVRNGHVGGFNVNVAVMNSENIHVKGLTITGFGLAPNNGPSEIGILLLQSRASIVKANSISSVNLGIFVRGANSTGNRIFENSIVGGAIPGINLLGICYNPAPNSGTEGPRGDNIYNNHITRFGYAFALSSGSVFNVFNENVSASFAGDFREPENLVSGGGTNISEGNLAVTIPQTVLPN
ncbi:MAG: NosD domain-containing protein [bacterium]|nr:NosD domain-containing protein [bacterium]